MTDLRALRIIGPMHALKMALKMTAIIAGGAFALMLAAAVAMMVFWPPGSYVSKTPAPWSALSPGDQLARYGECLTTVAVAQLDGTFDLTIDAEVWCATHQRDDPRTWPGN